MATVSFQDYAYSGDTNSDTYTFTGLDIGAADADRWVVAALTVAHNGSRSLDAVTIGGVSASPLYAAPTLSSGGARHEYWAANVPTGTTADVFISATPTAAGGFFNAGCAVYSASAEPTFEDGDFEGGTNSTTLTTNLDVPEGGAVLGAATNAFTGTLVAWTGATSDSADETDRRYYASADELTAETGRTVSVEFSATFNVDLLLVSTSVSFPAGGDQQDITGALFTNANSFGASAVSPGAVGIAGSLYQNANAFSASTITAGAVSISGLTYQNVNTFNSNTISAGAAIIAGALYQSVNAFNSSTITPGSVTVSGALYQNSNAFGANTVSPGQVVIAGDTFANENAFGASIITVEGGDQAINGTTFENENQFGANVISFPAVADETPRGGGFLPLIYLDKKGNPVDLNAVIEEAVEEAGNTEEAEAIQEAVQPYMDNLAEIVARGLAEEAAQMLQMVARIDQRLSDVIQQDLERAIQQAQDDEIATILLLAS